MNVVVVLQAVSTSICLSVRLSVVC